MFRLLLVTDKQEIRDLYNHYPDWNHQGFEIPTVEGSVDAGMRALKNQKFDAVSWLLPIREGKEFCEQIVPYGLYGIETVYDEGRLRKNIGNARRELMNRTREQQDAEPDDVLLALREGFLKDILKGNIQDADACRERIDSLSLGEIGADRPIAVASFRIPEGDRFYEERWKYGSPRLEYALSNAFGRTSGETFVLSLINPHHMRVILFSARQHREIETYRGMIKRISRVRRVLEQNFDLFLQIRWVNSYANLSAYIADSFMKSAH